MKNSYAHFRPVFVFSWKNLLKSIGLWKTTIFICVVLCLVALVITLRFGETTAPILIQRLLMDPESAPKLLFVCVPLLIGLLLLASMILFSQYISRSLLEEKTSKLMETLLVDVSPYSLVTGKLCAMMAFMFLQIAAWIVSCALGIGLGELIRSATHAQSVSFIGTLAAAFAQCFSQINAVAGRVAICIVGFVIAFVQYAMIAGFVNSFAGKPEDISNTIGVFLILMLIAFGVGLLPGAVLCYKSGTYLVAMAYVPIVQGFALPGLVLMGTVPVRFAVLACAEMLALSVAFAALAGWTYKAKVLFKGASPFGILVKNK